MAGTARAGAAFLKAWQTRHGGGFGAAWGPIVFNQQIAAMTAAISRAVTLSKAGGLSAAQHKHWAYVAGDEKKRLGTLNRELTTERAWRAQLTASDSALSTWIKAAGNTPSLRGNVSGWKSQLARQKTTIAGISKMLGYSNAYLTAHPAGAEARRESFTPTEATWPGPTPRSSHRRSARSPARPSRWIKAAGCGPGSTRR